MDDEAASQQLVSEARAPHSTNHDGTAIPLNLEGASTRGSSKKKSKKLEKSDKPKKTERKHLAVSQTSPSPLPTYSPTDLQGFVGESLSRSQALPSTAPSTQIEVPDSQVANGTPSPTPMTSSQAVSPEAAESKPTKSKRKRQVEAGLQDENIPATPHEAAGEGPSSQKRRKKRQSQASVDSVNADATEVGARPAATLDVPSSLAYRKKQDGVPHAPLTPKVPLQNLNAERSQRSRKSQSISKPPASAQCQQEMLEATPADVDAGRYMVDVEEELPDATGAITAGRTPGATQSLGNKNRTKKNKNIHEAPKLDWDAPVRNLNDTASQPFTFQDIDATEPTESHRKEKKRRRRKSTKSTGSAESIRYSVGGPPKTPSKKPAKHDPNKNYERARDDDDRTAADRALESTNELGHPPELRTSGDYSADEKELLRRGIRDFQQREGLDTADLVRIIHFGSAGEGAIEGDSTDQAKTDLKKASSAFWEEVRNVGLLRRFKDVKQHVRATYHTYQRGPWSEDEDEQLRGLVDLHPNEWKLIATQLNRLKLDVYNRWNDYLQHGEGRVTKRWSLEEEENFVKALSTVCQRLEDRRAEEGQPPLDDYLSVINWSEVCKEMGNTRSRIQCQYKLRQMIARVPPPTFDIEIKPRQTPPPGETDAELEVLKKPRRTGKRKSAVAKEDVKPPGPEDMLWGDKLDVLGGVIQQVFQGGVETEDQIIWDDDVFEKVRQVWSVPTLQTVYKELRELVPDAEEEEEENNLKNHLTKIYAFMKHNYFNELRQHYEPKHDVQVNGEGTPHANSSKKRKRQSGAGSAKKPAKKQDNKTPEITQFFKSKELVTESDNAESEREA